ncbi:hypothetical protein PMAYCL1PPCAC_24971, partial [Pristionchus mayeri]
MGHILTNQADKFLLIMVTSIFGLIPYTNFVLILNILRANFIVVWFIISFALFLVERDRLNDLRRTRELLDISLWAARDVQNDAQNMLAAGHFLPIVRAQCEPDTLEMLTEARDWLSSILERGNVDKKYKDDHSQFIADFEE